MNTLASLRQTLSAGGFDAALQSVYGISETAAQRERYEKLAALFATLYGEQEDVRFFSAPGRTEVCGNHTDHNRGCVLAAAINLDVVACAAKNDKNTVYLKSVEYPSTDIVDLNICTPVEAEREHSPALIRGVAARMRELGYRVGGFNAATTTRVLSGSGLSSSAAFEVLVGTIFNYLYNDGKIPALEIAKIAQYAENHFYGKPCGLMDQTACAVGGFVEIDFADTEKPALTPVAFDLARCAHALVITDTRAGHADLTDEYAAIRREMESVAGFFGKKCLRETDETEFMKNIAAVRAKCGDRACLRAIHFYNDNRRVEKEANALQAGDFEAFKALVNESGESSFMYNQNVYAAPKPDEKPGVQPVALALAVSDTVLRGRGAWRVHGGGFAGTIQAFVPDDLLPAYVAAMEGLFGSGACYTLSVRAKGGVEVCQPPVASLNK